jgi:hypothetical protein
MSEPDFPIVLSETEYIDDGGMTATRRHEIVEHDCSECGYDRAEIEVRSERERNDMVARVKCMVCNHKEFPFCQTSEL